MSKALSLAQLTNPVTVAQGGTSPNNGSTAPSFTGKNGYIIVYDSDTQSLKAVNNPSLGVVQETVQMIGTQSAPVSSASLNLSAASVFIIYVGGSTSTTITFASPPANNNLTSFTLIIRQPTSGQASAIMFPNSVRWAGGPTAAPPTSGVLGGQDTYTFFTLNQGGLYTGSLAINDSTY